MSLEQRERKYEILIRYNEDGSIGAHQCSIKEILDNGQIISAQVQSPVALATKDSEEGQQLSEFLGEATVDALAANASLVQQLESKDQLLESYEAEILRLQSLIPQE